MSFQYKARDPQQWEKRSKQSGSQYEGFALDQYKTFSLKKDNWIRILPPTWDEARHYGMDIWVHFGVGPSNGTVLCLYKMQGKPCPVCEAHARAEARGDEKATSELKPTRRVLVWLIDRQTDKPGEEVGKENPMLWAMPWTVDREISTICKDRTTGELFMIDHPESGYDVTFTREGEKGVNVKYVGFRLSSRATAIDPKFLDYIAQNDLKKTLNWRTYDEVKSILEGAGTADPQEAVAPPTTQAQPSAPPSTSASTPPSNVVAMPSTPPPVPPPAVVAAPPPPPKAFVSDWTGTNCSQCGKPQYTISPTELTCELGHRGPLETNAGNGVAATPSPIAASTAPERTEKLKNRFNTGPKQ